MSTIPQVDLRMHDLNMRHKIRGCGRRRHVWFEVRPPDKYSDICQMCAKCGKLKSRSCIS